MSSWLILAFMLLNVSTHKAVISRSTHRALLRTVGSETEDPGVVSSITARSLTFLEVDHEKILTVIFILPLIQEGLLSVTSESMCTKYWLTA